jgi:methylenetetrahydrofolate dehydrogenase (NADP+) / methenyltetrahydrofolate cyclohydrolase
MTTVDGPAPGGSDHDGPGRGGAGDGGWAIDGRAIAAGLRTEVATLTEALRGAGITPTLVIVLPTADESAAWYVRAIERAAEQVGIVCEVRRPERPDGAAIAGLLDRASEDPRVHAIVCQTPLPPGVDPLDVGPHIAVTKDVDGANPLSLGRLAAGLPGFAPATAAAVLEILRHEKVPLSGARAVVVGRSIVVGKPAALLLTAADATVTLCHSRTVELAERCAEADILVAAIGRAGLITGPFVKPGAVVIDVGTNPTEDGHLVGDVDASAAARAGRYTPVPGGVGPVTTMLLLRHVVSAARPD